LKNQAAVLARRPRGTRPLELVRLNGHGLDQRRIQLANRDKPSRPRPAWRKY
jgi:hypothetical protein